METKSVFASKTFWINLLTTAIAILSAIDPHMVGVDARYILMASGIINIFLRFLTNQPISISGS